MEDHIEKLLVEAREQAHSGNYAAIYAALNSPFSYSKTTEEELKKLLMEAIETAAEIYIRMGSIEGIKAILEDPIVRKSGFNLKKIEEKAEEAYANYLAILSDKGGVGSIPYLVSHLKKSGDKKFKENLITFVKEVSKKSIDMMAEQGVFEGVMNYQSLYLKEVLPYLPEEVVKEITDYIESKLPVSINKAIEVLVAELSIYPTPFEVFSLATELEDIARREDLPLAPRIEAAKRAAEAYFSLGLSSLENEDYSYFKQSVASLTEMLFDQAYDYDEQRHRQMTESVRKIKEFAREKRRSLVDELLHKLIRSKDVDALYRWSVFKEIPENLRDWLGKEANKLLYETVLMHPDKKTKKEALQKMFNVMSKGIMAENQPVKLREPVVIDCFDKFVALIPSVTTTKQQAESMLFDAIKATEWVGSSEKYAGSYRQSVEIAKSEIEKAGKEAEEKLRLNKMGADELINYAKNFRNSLGLRQFAVNTAIVKIEADESLLLEDKLKKFSSWVSRELPPESLRLIKERFKNSLIFLTETLDMFPSKEQSFEDRAMATVNKLYSLINNKSGVVDPDLVKEVEFVSADLSAKAGIPIMILNRIKAGKGEFYPSLSEADRIAIKDYYVTVLPKAIENHLRLLRKVGSWRGLVTLYMRIENIVSQLSRDKDYSEYSNKIRDKTSEFISSLPNLLNELAMNKIFAVHIEFSELKQEIDKAKKEELVGELNAIINPKALNGLRGKVLGFDKNIIKMAWMEKVMIEGKEEDIEVFRTDLFRLFTSPTTSSECRKMAVLIASTLPDTFKIIADIALEILDMEKPYAPKTRAFVIEVLAEMALNGSQKELEKAKQVIGLWHEETTDPETKDHWPEMVKEAVKRAKEKLDKAEAQTPVEGRRSSGIIKIKFDTGGSRFIDEPAREDGEFAEDPSSAAKKLDKKQDKPEDKPGPKKPVK